MTWLTAPLGPKGQITLPKEIREVLGLKNRGDMVGFVIDPKTSTIRLTRMEIRPAESEYTEEELQKMIGLVKEPGGKKFSKAEDFLKNIEKL